MRDITDGGDHYFAADVLNYARNFPRGTLVLGTDGCEVTSDGTNMTLDIASGQAAIDDVVEDMPPGTVDIAPADTYDRYDLVVIEDTGTGYEYASVTGQQEKVTPTLQSDQVLLAIIFVGGGTSTISTGDVLDGRILSTRTEDDGSFNTLSVLTAPSEADDVARKAELDQKSENTHDHTGEHIKPAKTETGDIFFTDDVLVIGQGASDGGYENVTVLGRNAEAGGIGSVVIGNNADATSSNTVAVGQEANADAASTVAIGANADALGSFSYALGGAARSTYSIAIGASSEVSDRESISIGHSTYAGGSASVALGENADTGTGDDSVAIGHDATTAAQDAIALGWLAESTALAGISIGRGTTSDAKGAIALGIDAEALGIGSIALGDGALAQRDGEAHINCEQLRFGADTETVSDQDLREGEMTVGANETASQFEITYKDSGGNIQTGSIQFD